MPAIKFAPVLDWRVKVFHCDTPSLYALITDDTLELLLSRNDGNLKEGWCYGMAQVGASAPTMTVPDFIESYHTA